MMRYRILVADQGEARFYDTLGFARPLAPAGSIFNPAAHQHERDLVSDRPGRVFNSAAAPGRRRGASPRHATGGESTARQHQVELFARRVGAELGRAYTARRFDRLIVVAAPAFLGRLRRALPAALRRYLLASLASDLVHHPPAELGARLPREMFSGNTGFAPAPRAFARSYR